MAKEREEKVKKERKRKRREKKNRMGRINGGERKKGGTEGKKDSCHKH